MLDFAAKYETELQGLMLDTAFKEEYKYYNPVSWVEKYKIAEDTWSKHEFVSIHNGKILGYIGYKIDRDAMCAYGLRIINFTGSPSIIFAKDLHQALQDIFDKFKFRKLKFSVIIGNPIERSYDRWINKYGGRIVGIEKEEAKLYDGTYADMKNYEIFRDEYLKTKGGGNAC